ncbi:MAG: hypothetical protein J7M25_01500 [Deltaproteobacteria bacterium]|nr:hypothetical protein [Deltaproteobacteria bacterium]
MNKNKQGIMLVLALAFGMSIVGGCYGASVYSSGARGDGIVRRSTGISWAWGLTTTTTRAFACRQGLAYVKTYWPWWAWAVQWFTGGIVTPITKEYMCSAGPAPMAAPAPAAGPPPAVAPGQPAAPPPGPDSTSVNVTVHTN